MIFFVYGEHSSIRYLKKIESWIDNISLFGEDSFIRYRTKIESWIDRSYLFLVTTAVLGTKKNKRYLPNKKDKINILGSFYVIYYTRK